MNVSAQFPVLDVEAIASFVDVVFGSLTGFVPVRILAEKGGPDLKPRCSSLAVGPGLVPELLRLATEAAEAKAGLFVAPGTMLARGRGTAGQMRQTAVVLTDLDDGDIEAKRTHLVHSLGEPTLEVASGGVTSEGQRKLHLYWALSRPASGDDLVRVVAIRKIMAEKAGGDPAFGSSAQLIRVPGSIHAKEGKPRMVDVIAQRARRFDLGSFEAAALDMQRLAQPHSRALRKQPNARQ